MKQSGLIKINDTFNSLKQKFEITAKLIYLVIPRQELWKKMYKISPCAFNTDKHLQWHTQSLRNSKQKLWFIKLLNDGANYHEIKEKHHWVFFKNKIECHYYRDCTWSVCLVYASCKCSVYMIIAFLKMFFYDILWYTIYMYTFIYIHSCLCIYTFIYIYICTYIYVYINIYMYICIYKL